MGVVKKWLAAEAATVMQSHPVKAIHQSSSLLGKAFMRGLVETVGTWPLENPWPYCHW